ncbi:hypothetical protein JOB18_015015 [Solea senegalensis]|uniref:Uncharacterized protein n=1 Tax=Solea senegalensis TaxID=28829 RepID=A0AAV6PQS5_SOLSE|nr:hypothetical protein JOB18_015015 [Solea senegalensis]
MTTDDDDGGGGGDEEEQVKTGDRRRRSFTLRRRKVDRDVFLLRPLPWLLKAWTRRWSFDAQSGIFHTRCLERLPLANDRRLHNNTVTSVQWVGPRADTFTLHLLQETETETETH